jgi:hypothetical protein
MKPVTRIVEIIAAQPFSVTCRFGDKSVRVVDFADYINEHQHHRLVAPLLNPNWFMAVSLDEIGGLVWANGFDCSPLSAYELGVPVS